MVEEQQVCSISIESDTTLLLLKFLCLEILSSNAYVVHTLVENIMGWLTLI